MVQINVTVQYEGRNYLTNVIASRDASEEAVAKQAMEQVRRQWK